MSVWGEGHTLFVGRVVHARFLPKKYQFSVPMYWPLFCYDTLKAEKAELKPVRYESFWPWSFYDRDHLTFGRGNLRQQLCHFLQISEVKKILILAQPRMLGYVFNPVSFFFIERASDDWCCVIQIGNTFNELKPYNAGRFEIDSQGARLSFLTPKGFYISPFIALTNTMNFNINFSSDRLHIHVDDYRAEQLELVADFQGRRLPLDWRNWLLMQVFSPWQTVVIIFLIHWHALKLWLMRIPYFKKKDVTSFESGVLKWKLSKRTRMNLPKI